MDFLDKLYQEASGKFSNIGSSAISNALQNFGFMTTAAPSTGNLTPQQVNAGIKGTFDTTIESYNQGGDSNFLKTYGMPLGILAGGLVLILALKK